MLAGKHVTFLAPVMLDLICLVIPGTITVTDTKHSLLWHLNIPHLVHEAMVLFGVLSCIKYRGY